MGLTREKADKWIRETPHGRFAFYDQTRGEPVKPDEWKPPDFRSLLQAAQTEQGRSEVSCVIDHDHPQVTMAKPMMIFTDDTRPCHFTFANQVGVQTDEDAGNATSIPDELCRTIDSDQLGSVFWHHPHHVCEASNAEKPPSRWSYQNVHESASHRTNCS